MTFDEILEAVVAERARQRTNGFDAEHDKGHAPGFFVALLAKHMGDVALAHEFGETVGKNSGETLDYKTEVVQLIAVGFAALERER